jgi:uncharacterized membrane protein
VHYDDVIEKTGMVIDAAGVAVIVLGSVAAAVVAVNKGRDHPGTIYRGFRQRIGRAILLGLELLVAGDIVRTVATEPNLTSVGVLAIVVAIRTFLSFSLEVEISGRWPWQKRTDNEPSTD